MNLELTGQRKRTNPPAQAGRENGLFSTLARLRPAAEHSRYGSGPERPIPWTEVLFHFCFVLRMSRLKIQCNTRLSCDSHPTCDLRIPRSGTLTCRQQSQGWSPQPCWEKRYSSGSGIFRPATDNSQDFHANFPRSGTESTVQRRWWSSCRCRTRHSRCLASQTVRTGSILQRILPLTRA